MENFIVTNSSTASSVQPCEHSAKPKHCAEIPTAPGTGIARTLRSRKAADWTRPATPQPDEAAAGRHLLSRDLLVA